MHRRQGDDRLPVVLERRRLYILPTRAGAAFGALLFLMLVAGLNYANSLALFLTFLLAAFVLVVMQLCHRNLLGVQVQSLRAAPLFAGSPGVLRVWLGNEAGTARLGLEAALEGTPRVAADVAAGARACLDVPLAAARRGRVRIARVRLSTAHPFGLFRVWTWVHAPLEVWVYPRPLGRLPMPVYGELQSGRQAHLAAGADEWSGLRPFRDGDSPRAVDWKAYAREAPLLVKEYTAGGAELRLFDFAALRLGDTEARLCQLARWVVDAEAQGERYGLLLPSLRLEPDRGPEHRHRCLAALAAFGLGPGG